MVNNYMFNDHLLKACLVAVFAIGLAACSSSDNDPATDAGMEQTPDEQELAKLREENDRLQQQIDDAEEEDRRKAAEAAVATAAKLYAGISAPTDSTSNAARRHAAYSGGNIAVSIGTATAVNLSEDKKTMVDANFGWEGTRYMAEPDGGGTYEAFVYSNVGDPTPGDKFSEEYTDDISDGTLDQDTTEGTAARVASPSFDQSAGVKTFDLPTNTVAVMISGSYHGVAGTYSCVPGSGNKCAARLAESGFDLGGVTAANAFAATNAAWTFKPSNPDALVMSVPDAIYASYGWWIHKSEDGETFTASAFVADRGDVPDASDIGTLRGTATYTGGAVGKYALRSSTGGTNDAGHFTARATLEADFNDDMISGTIDNFVGADGQARNWSVELKDATISDVGVIARNDPDDTAWTIDGTAASASGDWSGSLQDNGGDGVPKVATGTFSSEFGMDGKMVGAFGANKQ